MRDFPTVYTPITLNFLIMKTSSLGIQSELNAIELQNYINEQTQSDESPRFSDEVYHLLGQYFEVIEDTDFLRTRLGVRSLRVSQERAIIEHIEEIRRFLLEAIKPITKLANNNGTTEGQRAIWACQITTAISKSLDKLDKIERDLV
jgi:hypothetical protein